MTSPDKPNPRAAISRWDSAPSSSPRRILGSPGYHVPSGTLRIAGVGVGGMGRLWIATPSVVITNDAEVNAWVNPPYRKGWSL